MPSRNGHISEIVRRALAPKLAQTGAASIDDKTDLVGLGLIDSSDLLEVIIMVEGEAGVEFNPEGLDLEFGMTLEQLVSAFTAPSNVETEKPRIAAARS